MPAPIAPEALVSTQSSSRGHKARTAHTAALHVSTVSSSEPKNIPAGGDPYESYDNSWVDFDVPSSSASSSHNHNNGSASSFESRNGTAGMTGASSSSSGRALPSRRGQHHQTQGRSSMKPPARSVSPADSYSSYSSMSSSCYARKSVTFAPAVRVHLTLGRWELSALEHAHTWTSSHDTKSSQDGILDTVRHMRRLLTQDGELAPDCESTLLSRNRTSRGVEHMRTRQSIAARRQIKLDVVDAVLEEQHRQRVEGVDNPVTVAEASMLVSKRCRTKAAVRGGEDAAMARVLHSKSTESTDDTVKKTTTKGHSAGKSTSTSRSSRRTSSRYSTTSYNSAALDDDSSSSEVAIVDPASLTAVSLDAAQAGNSTTSKEDKAEVDTMFTNISHKRLRDKLLQRVSGLALGA